MLGLIAAGGVGLVLVGRLAWRGLRAVDRLADEWDVPGAGGRIG